MVKSITEINARRRERYNAKKYITKQDEKQEVISERDENQENNKSNTTNETKPEPDIYELLYNNDTEFEGKNPTIKEPIQQQPIPKINNDKPLSLHRKNKPIESRTMKLFERIQNNQINIDEPNITKPKSQPKNNNSYDNSDVKDRILLQHKIKQYIILFPNELKKYKVKPNASILKLKEHLEEIEVLISLSSVDTFIMDSIFYCIKMVEGISARTQNYNIEGLAEILKKNDQFLKLCKQLYLKYNTFEAVPAEYQLVMIVSTSAYICMQKNKSKSQLNDILNQPYIPNDDETDDE
jgi:hypothetical protein